MKNLSKYIKESLINEHFVNCKTDEEMNKYADIVWNILKKAYEYCGGIKNVNSGQDLIKDTHLWKLYRKNNEINTANTMYNIFLIFSLLSSTLYYNKK